MRNTIKISTKITSYNKISGIIIGSLGFLPALSKTNLYENEKNVQQLTLLNWKEWQIYSEKNILIISFNKPNNGACKSFAPEYVKAAKAFEVFFFLIKFLPKLDVKHKL